MLEAVEKKMSKYAKYGTWKSLSKHNSRAVSTATHDVYVGLEEEIQRDLRKFNLMLDDAMNIFNVSNSSSPRATRIAQWWIMNTGQYHCTNASCR